MHVYILFAHPAQNSFSRAVLAEFTRGLQAAQHTYQVGDLYQMAFQSEMSADEYRREVQANPDAPVPPDVKAEQEKIQRAEALAFIYPLWWSDCPAKLKGWFDRVFTHGYAYFYNADGDRSTQINIEKAIVICSAGHTAAHLEEIGIAESMRRVMLNDRLLGVGVNTATMEILGGMMPHDNTFRQQNLEKAFWLGRNF